MKNKKFFNLDQAIRYLGETVISFKGKPIYIYALDAGRHSKNFELYYYDVGDEDRKQKWILSDHSGIDMTPVSLGLMSTKSNMKHSSGMVARMPVRMWKIGLNRSNVRIDNTVPEITARYRSRYADFMLSKELRDTVVGDYPSYEECYKVSAKDGNVLAFSRRFAVHAESIYYKALGVPVGDAKASGPKLYKDCFFLKEALEEDTKHA
jgi:hypothetical protein